MGIRHQLRRLAVYLLGVVDQYWALREPGQYGNQPPQCGLSCEGDSCDRADPLSQGNAPYTDYGSPNASTL